MPKQDYENHLDQKEARWFAVYTPYKREKMAVKDLQKKGIEVYLPLQKIVKKYTRKTKVVELPLISCYLFVKIVKSEYVRVLETEYILSFVRFSKNLIAIPEEEIEVLKKVLNGEVEVEAQKTEYYEGDKVEITNGSLAGMKGKLIAKEGKRKVVVELDHLGYSLLLTLDTNTIRKIPQVAVH